MSALLLDTGPVVASLDRSDPHHEWVMQRFSAIQGRVITTGAVITEAAFFLQDVRDGTPNLIALVEALRLEIWDCFGIEALRSAERLMARYGDAPMDFADATLVLAAHHYPIGNTATLHHPRFPPFHYPRNNPF